MQDLLFGIIGSGMIAEYHAAALNDIDGCRVAAIFNPESGLADALANKTGARAYTSMDEFLAHPDMAAVTVATPSGLHLDGALPAIQAGKHVIVEKPLEITVERCDRIIRAADEAGVLLAGIFNNRFSVVAELIKKAVDAGRLGVLAVADAQVKWYRTQEYYDSGVWRGTWKLDGGGALMNQSIHAIDLLQWFAGPVCEVCGVTATLAHERIEVEDTAVATIRFVNGALGVVEGTTCAYPGFLKRIELCGSTGSIIMEEDRLLAWDFAEALPEDEEIRRLYLGKSDSGGGAADPSSINYLGHKKQFMDFADAIRHNRPPAVDGRDARKAVAIIQAIYRSADQCGPVAL